MIEGAQHHDCDTDAAVSHESTSEEIQWPADRLYWAILEMPALPGKGTRRPRAVPRLPEGVLEELRVRMPERLEDLHAVATEWTAQGSTSNRTELLICAARRDDVARLPEGTRSLTPETVPDFVLARARGSEGPPDGRTDSEAAAALAASLNLLVGPYEPRSRRRRRRNRHALVALWVIACTAVVCAGLHRRANGHERAAERAEARTRALLAPTQARTAQQLVALVASQARITYQAEQVQPATDATSALTAMLNAWPRATQAERVGGASADGFVGPPDPVLGPVVEVQSLSVQEGRAMIAAVVVGGRKPSRDELAERLLSEFRAPMGWSMEEPRWTHQAVQTRLTFVLNRERPTAVSGSGGRVSP